METILACLMLASLAGIVIGLFSAIVNKIRKKPVKMSLKMMGISIVVFMATIFIYPETPDWSSGSDKNQEDTVSDTEKISVQQKVEDDTSVSLSDRTEELEKEQTEPEQDVGDREEDYIGDDLFLDKATVFSEGRAWVQYKVIDKEKGSVEAFNDVVDAAMGDDLDRILYWADNYGLQGNKAALIDTAGKILWESASTNNHIVLEEASEFRDGLAYCKWNGDDKKTYMIIDSEGNEVFTKDFDEDFLILGHGGGLVLVAEHTADFSTNEWKIGAIDKNGSVAVPFQVYENKPYAESEPVEAPSGEAPDPNYDYFGYLEYHKQLEAHEEYERNSNISYALSFDSYYKYNEGPCEYLGDGVFHLSCSDWNIFLNIKTQKIIYSDDSYQRGMIKTFISDFKDGAATVLCNDDNGQAIYSFGTDGTFSQFRANDWIRHRLRSDMEFGDDLVFASDTGVEDTIFGRLNLGNLATGAYYNMVGERVIDFPEYNDKNLSYCGTPFQNGYAVLFIQGADEYLYMTVINKKGKPMFDPKTGFNPAYMSEDGKYLTAIGNGFLTVFNVKGEALVDVTSSTINPNYGMEYNACDGMVKVQSGDMGQYFYVNVKNGTVIGTYINSKDSVTVY